MVPAGDRIRELPSGNSSGEKTGDLDGWDDGLPTTIPVKSMLEVQFTVYDLIC